MTATQTAFQALFASFAGLAVVDASDVTYKIARLDSKIGTMKNGTKAEYVVLTREDNEATVVSLHPNVADKLFKKGDAATYKIKSVSADQILEAEAQAELSEAQAIDQMIDKTLDIAATVVEIAEEVKGPSKKELALKIYGEVVSVGGARAAVIARFKAELGMGAPGASTYYQNCKKLWA